MRGGEEKWREEEVRSTEQKSKSKTKKKKKKKKKKRKKLEEKEEEEDDDDNDTFQTLQQWHLEDEEEEEEEEKEEEEEVKVVVEVAAAVVVVVIVEGEESDQCSPCRAHMTRDTELFKQTYRLSATVSVRHWRCRVIMAEVWLLSAACVTFHSRVARGVSARGKGANLRPFLSRVARSCAKKLPRWHLVAGARSEGRLLYEMMGFHSPELSFWCVRGQVMSTWPST